MNIWKDIRKERITPNDFVAVVEIAKGSKCKYELDKETGMIIMDRVLYTSTHYPMNYGFIPLTYAGDHDPLDVFVLCSQPIEIASLVRVFPVGVVKMIDNDEEDEKIIAIPFGDPQYNKFTDIAQLPTHISDELMHFLTVYKQLENKKVQVVKLEGSDEAKNCILKALELYQKEFVD